MRRSCISIRRCSSSGHVLSARNPFESESVSGMAKCSSSPILPCMVVSSDGMLMPKEASMNPQGQAGSTADATYDPAVALQFFKSAGKPVDIAAGEKIFEENERAIPLLRRQKMYLLLKGEVSLMSGPKTIGRVRPGEVFGEMAVISDAPRSDSAVAKTASRVITLDDKEFEAALGRHPEFALMLMSVMIFRLRNTIAQLKSREALSDDAGLKESAAFDPEVLSHLVEGLADAPPIFYQAGASIVTEGQKGLR